MFLHLEKKFLKLALENYLGKISILQMSRLLKCAPSVLEKWLNDEHDNDLNLAVYEYLSHQIHYDQTLKIPFIRTSTFLFIESIYFGSLCNTGCIYILYGGPGSGKTKALEFCAELYSEKMVYINTVNINNNDTRFINKTSLLDKEIFAFDNIIRLSEKMIDYAKELLDQHKNVLWVFDTNNYKGIRNPISAKARLYLVPGLSEGDYNKIFNAIDFTITDNAKRKILILTIPNISRLFILLDECKKIVYSCNKKIVDIDIVGKAWNTVFNYPGW